MTDKNTNLSPFAFLDEIKAIESFKYEDISDFVDSINREYDFAYLDKVSIEPESLAEWMKDETTLSATTPDDLQILSAEVKKSLKERVLSDAVIESLDKVTDKLGTALKEIFKHDDRGIQLTIAALYILDKMLTILLAQIMSM